MRIHCNLCAIIVSAKTVPAFITSCSHIFCQPCLRPAAKHTCPLCGARSAAIPLNKTMPAKVMLVFADKPGGAHVQETLKIRRFRMLQYGILLQMTERRMRSVRRRQALQQRIEAERRRVAVHRGRIAKVREMRAEIRTKFSKLFEAMKRRAPLETVRELYISAKRTFARCEQLMASAKSKKAI